MSGLNTENRKSANGRNWSANSQSSIFNSQFLQWVLDNLLELALIFALLMVILTMEGCATCPTSPPENAIIMTNAGIPIMIPKGYFDDKENWLTEQQFADWLKAMQGQEEEKKGI